jgi:hypothetical protein
MYLIFKKVNKIRIKCMTFQYNLQSFASVRGSSPKLSPRIFRFEREHTSQVARRSAKNPKAKAAILAKIDFCPLAHPMFPL